MKKFSTKKALVLSVLSLCLCLAMLLGTTFAWFTDEVTSSGNIIQTGTLKVGMYWVEGDEVVPTDKKDAAWQDASKGAMFDNTLWEPGYVEAKHIMIANEGTLALNYKLRIVANGAVSKLSDVIDVYYFETAEQLTRDSAVTGTKLGTLTEVLGGGVSSLNALQRHVYGSLTAGETRTLTLALKMQETAGNEYQNLSIGADFSIQLLATQHTYEEDSFDDQYDVNFPDEEAPYAYVRPLEGDDLNISYTAGIGGAVSNGKLDVGYQFQPTIFNQYPDGNNVADDVDSSIYKHYHADFYVYADRDVPANSIGLAGYYDAWCQYNDNNWVALTNDGLNIKANEGIRLVESMGTEVTYKNICQYGNDGIGFLCGAYAIDAEALAGTTLTVELRLYKTDVEWTESTHGACNETGEDDYITIGEFKYTFPKFIGSSEDFEAEMNKDVENIVVELTSDVTYDVAAWANNAMGGASTKTVVINGNGHTITFNQTNSDWNNIVVNDGAKLIINDAHLTNSGHNDGPWNRHDLNFGCAVELNNVTSDKAMAFKADATLKNVTINDKNTSDTYAIWIQSNGQTVDIDGLEIDMLGCTDGRGIKIDNQYNEADEKAVTLNIKNATFKTEEKAAIIVKTAVGATINAENLDIAGVAADSTNAVWVDEASASYADKVVVNGANKIVEP